MPHFTFMVHLKQSFFGTLPTLLVYLGRARVVTHVLNGYSIPSVAVRVTDAGSLKILDAEQVK
jgi:hypothetical protein